MHRYHRAALLGAAVFAFLPGAVSLLALLVIGVPAIQRGAAPTAYVINAASGIVLCTSGVLVFRRQLLGGYLVIGMALALLGAQTFGGVRAGWGGAILASVAALLVIVAWPQFTHRR